MDTGDAPSASQEKQWVEACQAGDLAQFDPLYRQYVDQIYAYLYRRLLRKDSAEDLTSVTFMRALEKIHQYKSAKGPFAAWLYTIAKNALTDHFRTLRPHADIETVWDLSSDEDVEMNVKTQLAKSEVREALQKLDASKREVVLLRLWEGLSYKEIAAITGKTETNCKVIFARAVEALRKEMPLAAFLIFLASPFRL